MATYRYGVIVVTRDRPDLLRECLRRLAASLNGGPRPALVVYDNGSDPETPAICAEYGAERLGGTGENVSFARANNEAARRFRGDVLLLNNDVEVFPGCLEALVAGRRAGCDLVGAKLLYPDGTIQHFGIGFSRDYQSFHLGRGQPATEPWMAENRVVAAATGACLLIRRRCWDELGGLDEGYVFGWEDVDFCLRAREQGYICGVVHEAVAVHHESQTAGRSSFDSANWQRYQESWVRTGRVHAALGVWPMFLSNALLAVHGPDRELAGDFAGTGD